MPLGTIQTKTACDNMSKSKKTGKGLKQAEENFGDWNKFQSKRIRELKKSHPHLNSKQRKAKVQDEWRTDPGSGNPRAGDTEFYKERDRQNAVNSKKRVRVAKEKQLEKEKLEAAEKEKAGKEEKKKGGKKKRVGGKVVVDKGKGKGKGKK